MKKSIFKFLSIAVVMIGLSPSQHVVAQQKVVNEDSLSISLGLYSGYLINSNYNDIPDSLKKMCPKTEIIKGLEYVLSADTNSLGRQIGVSLGMHLTEQITKYEQMGVKIDRKKVVEEFAKAIYHDSVPVTEFLTKYKNIIQTSEDKLRKEAQRQHLAEIENSPEAIANKKAGEKFIANLKKKDKKIKTTASGLSYKIIEKGTGDKITDVDYVEVAYKGSLIDGTVFEDSKGEYYEFRVLSVVPGFSEGLKLLNKGGKAVFYIPGNLGYGPQGQSHAGIGPNAMLIFEVEIINPTEVKEPKQKKRRVPVAPLVPVPAPKPEPKEYESNNIYMSVDEEAQYPGGDEALFKFVYSNIKYPKMAVKQKIEGRVIVSFVIEKDGSIGLTKITAGKHELLDKEAIRVVGKIPCKFKPAQKNGKVVRSWFNLPIYFNLKNK